MMVVAQNHRILSFYAYIIKTTFQTMEMHTFLNEAGQRSDTTDSAEHISCSGWSEIVYASNPCPV